MVIQELIANGRRSLNDVVANPNGVAVQGLNVTYSDQDVTVDDMATLRELTATTTHEEDAVRHMLLLFKIDWNLETYTPYLGDTDQREVGPFWTDERTGVKYCANDKGEPIKKRVEPTYEGMASVSLKILAKIMEAVQADIAPKAETSEA